MENTMPTTIPGSDPNTPITVSAGSGDVLNLAAQIGALLANIQSAGNLVVHDTGDGPILPTVAGSGKTTELIFDPTGAASATIPAGWNYVADLSPGPQPSTLTGADFALIGSSLGGVYNVSGHSTVAAEGGDNTISATGSYVLSFAPGNNLINANGAGTIATDLGNSTVNSAGNDLIVLGGNDLVSLGGAAETILGGTGSSTISGNGPNDLIFGDVNTTGGSLTLSLSGAQATVSTGDSSATVTAAGSNGLVFGGTTSTPGMLNVVDSGTNDTIVGINSPMTVTAGTGSSGLLVFGGPGGLDFVGGDSSATVFSAAGSNTVAGGTGGLLFSAGGNDAVSGAPPGGATLFGTSASSVTYTGAGNLLYAAGAGNETLNAAGSTGANYFVASSIAGTNDSIVGGSGADTMIAGAGSDTFSGGPGGVDTFAFFSQVTAGSHDFITGLTPDDNVALGGYGPNATSTSTSDGSTTITLRDNTQITFVNVINPTNVHFG
jgi:hypothetical protein